SANAPLAAQSWHHLAVVAADAISVYVDGVRAAEVAMPLPALTGNGFLGGAAAKPPEPIAAPLAKQPARKGAQPDPAAAPMPFFKGELDELQISKIDRGAGFIRLAAIGQGPNSDKLIVPGQEDQSGGFGSGYFSIILQSVTPDGWVVIALLAVMAVISWVVMASKASYLSRVERADRQFTANFRQAASQLAKFIEQNRRPPTQATAADNSPLRRVFEVGAAEVRSRTDGTRPLHADAIEAIRASMEAVALRETQRPNKSMVLPTLALSGRPFLGLRGEGGGGNDHCRRDRRGRRRQRQCDRSRDCRHAGSHGRRIGRRDPRLVRLQLVAHPDQERLHQHEGVRGRAGSQSRGSLQRARH